MFKSSLHFKMWVEIVLFCAVFGFSATQDVGDSCIPNEQSPEGTCTKVTDCPDAVTEIRRTRRHSFYRCGFLGALEVVCCPAAASKFGTNKYTPTQIIEEECKKIVANSSPLLGYNILGGKPAMLGEFPHQVALGYDKGNGYKFECGGTVLSETYVLTAAHCIRNLDDIEPTLVRAGIVKLGGPQRNNATDYTIAQNIVHPNYSRSLKYHDLALIRLDRPMKFTPALGAVCLDTNEADLPIGSEFTVTGWGVTDVQRNLHSSVLMKAKLRAVASSECSGYYDNWRKLPDGIAAGQLCARDPDNVMDACQGDSGGPLYQEMSEDVYKQVGVTSFGRSCGSETPGVYTRVVRYLPWIQGVVWPRT